MVCPRNISVDTLHKGDTEDNNNNNNNNNSVEQCFLSEANSRPAAQLFPPFTNSKTLLPRSKQYDTKTENWIPKTESSPYL